MWPSFTRWQQPWFSSLTDAEWRHDLSIHCLMCTLLYPLASVCATCPGKWNQGGGGLPTGLTGEHWGDSSCKVQRSEVRSWACVGPARGEAFAWFVGFTESSAALWKVCVCVCVCNWWAVNGRIYGTWTGIDGKVEQYWQASCFVSEQQPPHLFSVITLFCIQA